MVLQKQLQGFSGVKNWTAMPDIWWHGQPLTEGCLSVWDTIDSGKVLIIITSTTWPYKYKFKYSNATYIIACFSSPIKQSPL